VKVKPLRGELLCSGRRILVLFSNQHDFFPYVFAKKESDPLNVE